MKVWICLMSLIVNIFCYAQSLELTYSTYLGGTQDDRAHGITCDGNGNVYLTAPIRSGDFPLTEHAIQTQNTEMYVASMNTTGEGLVLSTYLGVPGGSNYTHGVALDHDGNIYLVGNTTNANFPTTEGAYDRVFHGPANEAHGDAFVMKLSPDGSQVIYSTFLGGSGMDIAGKIAVDSEGNAIIIGCTGSSDLPVTESAFDQTFHGGGNYGREDVFVTKINSDGSALVFCTYIGGNGTELYEGITVDDTGAIYVYGTTTSTDFPVTNNALSPAYNGGSGEYGQGDSYLIKLSSDGSTLEYGSYIGGSQDESIKSIIIHDDGRITLGGGTYSTDFPITENALQTQLKGMQDGFILTLSKDLNSVEYGTFLGGSQNDYLFLCETNGHLILSGETESSDFPVTANAYQSEFKGSSDQFIAVYNPSSHELNYSTYFGGSGYDWGQLCVSGNQIYLAGHTTSRDFPMTEDAYNSTYNGGGDNRWGGDVFVSRFDYQTIPNPLEFKIGYCSYIGGSENEDGGAFLNLDGNGRVYVMLNTASSNCPTTEGAQDETYNGGSRFGGYGGDIYAAKFNEDGSGLDYGTYIGGKDHEFHSYFSTVDEAGHLYGMGMTRSDDFPTTDNAYDQTFNSTPGSDDPDLFVFKLNPKTGFFDWCTFIGGSGWETASSLTVGSDGSVYVMGHTNSADLPTTDGCFDDEYNGDYEAFVYKFSSSGDLDYATFLGMNDDFRFAGSSIAVDSKNQLWISKSVKSDALPVSADAISSAFNGGDTDIYWMVLSPDGRQMNFATYLGGQGNDSGQFKLDKNGSVLITGNTSSTDFPLTGNAFNLTADSEENPFFMRLDAEGKSIEFSTLLTGSFAGWYGDYMVLRQGDDTGDKPVTQQLVDVPLQGNQNIYLSIIHSQTGQLLYGTYIGGGANDYSMGICVDPNGCIWIGGGTESGDLPVTLNAVTAHHNNAASSDGFVIQLVPKQYHSQTSVDETVFPQIGAMGQPQGF